MNTRKIKWTLNLILIASGALFLTSCNKDYNYVPTVNTVITPTATKLSFKSEVAPIFIAHCAIPTCHDAPTKKMGLDFSSSTTSYSSLFTKVEIDTVANKANPELNKLYKKISNSGGSVGTMQKYLTDPVNQQSIILKWLKEGALNN